MNMWNNVGETPREGIIDTFARNSGDKHCVLILTTKPGDVNMVVSETICLLQHQLVCSIFKQLII